MFQCNRSANPLRVAFLGHSCAASAATLAVLLGEPPPGSVPANGCVGAVSRIRHSENGPEIICVILAGASGTRLGEPERMATRAGIPIILVTSPSDATRALREAAPDVAVAACFPWRLPRAARQIPPLGILNVHPSLLPSGRGPEPVFWTLRRGEQITGVTVHRMDGGFDTGPIVAQEEVPVPLDVRAPALENALMALGGELLIDALPALASGDLRPQPQRPDGITDAPVPSPADWTMVTSLPAAWAWRFARGVAPLGGPLTVIAAGAAIRVVDAVAWSPDERLPQLVIEDADGTVRVRYSPGWVRFRCI